MIRAAAARRDPAGPGHAWLATCAVAIGAFLASASPAAAMTVGPDCTLPEAVAAVNANDSGTGCGPVVSGGTTPIIVPSGLYKLHGELKVNTGSNLSITGADPAHPDQTTIDADRLSRVLEVASGGNVALSAVEVTGGQTLPGADGTGPGVYGGAGQNGGGILNAGSLSLDHVLVTSNRTGRGGSGGSGDLTSTGNHNGRAGGNGGYGGGIYTSGYLAVTSSTISSNLTGDGGSGGSGGTGSTGGTLVGGQGADGGPSGPGGGIFINFNGSAVVTDSTIKGNATGVGGRGGRGGNGAGGTPTQSPGPGGNGGYGGNNGRQYVDDASPNTIVTENGSGGGIASIGSLNMTRSTISGNATGAGGPGGDAGTPGQAANGQYYGNQNAGKGGGGGMGAGLLSADNTSSASLINVTIVNNRAGAGGHGGAGATAGPKAPGDGGFGGEGGGVWAQGSNGHGLVLLDHVTIAGNSLGAGGGAANPASPGANGVGGGIRTGGRSSPSGYGVSVQNSIVANNSPPNCKPYYDPATYEDIHDAGNNLTFYPVTDTTCPGANANPLLGALADNGGPTFTMLPGSGSPAIDAGTCDVSTDQRGFPRPASACDIGAVEVGARPGGEKTATLTSLSSSKNPSTAGNFVSFTASVGPKPDGGSVRFTDNAAVIAGCAAVPLAGTNHASCAHQYGASGSHAIVAQYLGSAKFGGSTSSTLTQVVKPGGSITGTQPTAAQVKAFLGKMASPGGKGAKIGALLKAGGFKFTANAPSAGTLALSWWQMPGGKHGAIDASRRRKPVRVAAVKKNVKKAGKVTAKIKLTSKGRKLLRHVKKNVKLTAKLSFMPKGGKATKLTRTFRLKR